MQLSNNLITCIQATEELTTTDLDVINYWRQKEFNTDKLINPKKEGDDWENKYFFVKDSKENILAFGILRLTLISFLNKTYPVFEFVSLVSTVKRKGYGSLVMQKMKEYAGRNGKTLIGFCTTDLLPFYLKLGFSTTRSESDRFVFKKDQWSFPGETPGETIFVGGNDGLIEKMTEHPLEIAYIERHKRN